VVGGRDDGDGTASTLLHAADGVPRLYRRSGPRTVHRPAREAAPVTYR